MGVFDRNDKKARTSAWRLTSINSSYEYCPTYPATIVVPAKISDTTLNYGRSYRSKGRIPGLVYLHWSNLGTITRSSQPMVGLKNNRSIQDEKLIEAIFTSHSQHHSNSNADMANASYIAHSRTVFGATPTNLIIDARPTTNAMANVAKGAGTENMDYYRNCKKVYLGIDNIHVMRESLNKIAEATRYPDRPVNYDLLQKSNWLKHLSAIIEGIVIVVKAVHLANSHVLVHCSDGWDRTSQLSSLSQLCLDPYYRTKEGLAVLIEKDWVSYGHKFADRCGHTVAARVQCLNTCSDSEDGMDEDLGFLASFQQRLNFTSSSNLRETCPVFDQFLDVIHQLQVQFPTAFEYNDTFLLHLQALLYDCSHGTFLYNSERERDISGVSQRTTTVWQTLLSPARDNLYQNESYDAKNVDVLFPEPKKVEWWLTWFKRPDLKAHDNTLIAQSDLPAPTIVDSTSEDPVLSAMTTDGTSSTKLAAVSSRSTTFQGSIVEPETASAAQVPVARPFPAMFDNPAVSSASTAVQGAMRSAWSAWKSVRTNYEAPSRDSMYVRSEGLSSQDGASEMASSEMRNEIRGSAGPQGVLPATLGRSLSTASASGADILPGSRSVNAAGPNHKPAVHSPRDYQANGASACETPIESSSIAKSVETVDSRFDPLGVSVWK